ncbi:MAG TPA: hypothetical protein VIT65_26805 [Microlunatus sp.]
MTIAGGRPPSFDKDRYRQRNTVERAVNKASITHYDKHHYNYRSTITVTSIRIWIRDLADTALSDRA